jgi:hypothetical protein
VFINDQILVYAQPVSLIQDNFPVFLTEPKRDGLGYQTKSSAQEGIDFQNVSSAMMNSIIHARRRAISDRVLYDPSKVSEAQINNENPSAKIPVRPSAYGKNVSEAVYAFPFRDDQSQLMLSEIEMLGRMGDKALGLNPARQGQFVKGNKTLSEYEGVMNNSNGREQLKALTYECQLFTPMKETLKNNILEKQTPATMWSRELQTTVKVDPVEMRKASIQFKMSDGLVPAEKIISGDMLGKALNVMQTNQGLSQQYNIASVFTFLMKTQNVDLLRSRSLKLNSLMSKQWVNGRMQLEQCNKLCKLLLRMLIQCSFKSSLLNTIKLCLHNRNRSSLIMTLQRILSTRIPNRQKAYWIKHRMCLKELLKDQEQIKTRQISRRSIIMSSRTILLEMFEFSERELKTAQLLPEINLQFIKTQHAFKVKERENLVPDPNNYAAFIQQESHIKGMIAAYEFLIDCHVNTVEALNVEAKAASAAQG